MAYSSRTLLAALVLASTSAVAQGEVPVIELGEAPVQNPVRSAAPQPVANTVPELTIQTTETASPRSTGYNSNSDLIVLLQQLQDEVRSLRGQLESQTRKIKRMEDEQRDRYRDLDRRISYLMNSAGTAAPATAPRPATSAATPATAPASASATDARMNMLKYLIMRTSILTAGTREYSSPSSTMPRSPSRVLARPLISKVVYSSLHSPSKTSIGAFCSPPIDAFWAPCSSSACAAPSICSRTFRGSPNMPRPCSSMYASSCFFSAERTEAAEEAALTPLTLPALLRGPVSTLGRASIGAWTEATRGNADAIEPC